MTRLPLYAITFLLTSASHLLLHASDDRLTPGEFISRNETLVSDGGAFALGFFSPTNSTTDFYVGMWYNDIPEKSVIWVANRDKPITDSSVTLRISDDSNLVVVDAKGGLLWSSNLTGLGAPGSDAAAVLLNSGNLVLRADSNSILWQSFDHPTDTMLPGMKIQYNRSSHSAIYITSWKDADDPSPGDYSLGVDPSTCLQCLIWSKSKPYWRSQVWAGILFSGERVPNSTSMTYVSVIADEDAISVTLSVSDRSPHIRYTMNYSGQIELLSWDHGSKHWRTWSLPNGECERYGWCGGFAYCDTTRLVPQCRCLEGFEPKVESECESGKNSAGCIRKKALRCGDDGDGFVRVEGMKLPDNFVFLRNTNFSGCRSQCLANCSCTAYAYSELPVGNANISRCLVWMGELIDTNMVSRAGEDLYLRLMDPSLGTPGRKSKTRKVAIAASLSAALFTLACIFVLWRCGKVLKGRYVDPSCYMRVLATKSTDEFVQGETDRDPELPQIDFGNLLLATNNFSESNKLGKGGFGIVYKGKLSGGQEIAVKRLVRGSGQGLEEFKNEVILIAKLQHRNLVRLLGCCIHGEKKLLVYEYMPNKSLDFLLFADPTQKTKLDWGKRFNIIKGIARALLYLHQDSRLRIIHRDVKASNVLLDEEMNPKVSDFGLAKIFGGNQDEANTDRVVGTYGYMSPEYAMEGLFSVKSDVYSYGVLLLEIVSGFRNSSFPLAMDSPNLLAYAWQLWNEGNAEDYVDPSIAGSCARAEVVRSIHVGLLCVQDSPSDRPAMSSVVFMLENEEATISAAPKQSTFTVRRNQNPHRGGDSRDDNIEMCSYNNVTITTTEGR
ncbi:unnamed protein product [Musa acuminata var. zebrina]